MDGRDENPRAGGDLISVNYYDDKRRPITTLALSKKSHFSRFAIIPRQSAGRAEMPSRRPANPAPRPNSRTKGPSK